MIINNNYYFIYYQIIKKNCGQETINFAEQPIIIDDKNERRTKKNFQSIYTRQKNIIYIQATLFGIRKEISKNTIIKIQDIKHQQDPW